MWFPNFWRVADPTDKLTAVSIQNKIHQINNSARAWIFEVEPLDWAALTREESKGRDGSEWVMSTFMRR